MIVIQVTRLADGGAHLVRRLFGLIVHVTEHFEHFRRLPPPECTGGGYVKSVVVTESFRLAATLFRETTIVCGPALANWCQPCNVKTPWLPLTAI